MEKYQNTVISTFSGGVQRNVSRLLMSEDECFVIQNGELEKIGPIKKTPGYLQKGSDVNSSYSILGAVGAYKPSTGTLKNFAIANNAADSDCYTFNPITNVWTPHHLSLTSGAKAEFESFLDGVFMVNFSDATRWNNLTQWYTTTNVTNAPKAKYIKLYLSRLYLFYVAYGGTTYMSRCVYSELPDSSAMTLSWNNALNFFDVDADDGDVGTGLEVNASRLMLFKENSLHRYDTNSLYKVPGCPGTVSQRTVKNIEGWTLYFHRSGIWGYNGTTSQYLSKNIEEIVKGVSVDNLSGTCATTEGDHYYLYVGDVNNLETGLQINNCLIDYDLSKNAFTWRVLDEDPTIFYSHREDTSATTYDTATLTYNDAVTLYNAGKPTIIKTYFGTKDGEIHEFNYGNSYNGNNISFQVETRDLYLGYPTSFKLFQKVNILHNEGQGVVVQARVDDKDWITLGRVTANSSELIFPAATRGRRIKFRISEISTHESFELEGLDVYYVLEGLVE